jgi:hypothetical protein
MDRRIRVASLIVSTGLIIALVSLLIHHPLAFVLFLVLGATLILIGTILYLIALVRDGSPPAAEPMGGRK